VGTIEVDRRVRACARWSLGLYLVVILATPALHDDFACHQHPSQHCAACTANDVADHTPDQTVLLAGVFLDAGEVVAVPRSTVNAPIVSATTGRSPPLVVC